MKSLIRATCLIVLLIPLLIMAGSAAGQQVGLTLEERHEIMRGAVDITACVEEGGDLVPVWGGSGTILSAEGLILTNAHVATDMFDE
jgi:S1-C subfamily serine protease